MILSKRHNSVLLEATIEGRKVEFARFTGVGHHPSSSRKRHGHLPYFRSSVHVDRATFADERDALRAAAVFVKTGKVFG